MHKRDHADELIQGKHFIVVRADESTGDEKTDARRAGLKRGNDTITLWTKRGIVRLGWPRGYVIEK